MTQQEQNVVEAARQLIAAYPPEVPVGSPAFRACLMALALAVRAMDLAARETWRGERDGGATS